jgi:phosphatidylinositol-3-phosphatase
MIHGPASKLRPGGRPVDRHTRRQCGAFRAVLLTLLTGVVAAVAVGCSTAQQVPSTGLPGATTSTGPLTTASSGKTTAPAPTTTALSGRDGVPSFSHVFVVVMENLGYDEALQTAGIAALASRYASATSWYAVAHPSLPNYLALTSGGTWGVTSDCVECFVDRPNLGEQLSDAGIGWGAYMEGIPSPCFLEDYGGVGYAAKHDPFRYYVDIRDSPSLCAHIEPLGGLAGLLAGAARSVPRLVWVTPDLCHDGHDCPPSQAAAWLDRFVDEVVSSRAWREEGVLFVTWDEGNGGDDATLGEGGRVVGCCGGGHLLTLVIARGVPAGERVGVPYDDYSLLATVEDSFRLPLLGAASAATPLSAFFNHLGPSSLPG